MKGFDLLGKKAWTPLSYFGLEHSFFNINSTTVVHTWIILGVLLILLIPVAWIMRKKSGVLYFIITSFVDYFVTLSKQSLGAFSITHFTFIAGLFTFIALCNSVSIFPWMEEPTTDLNTTLSLGITSFLYIQFFSIKTHGIWAYIKEYFKPFFLMLPLNVIGKFATIISLSFRLFGNIFGGAIIAQIYFGTIEGSWLFETFGIISGFNFGITIFFGLFEGFLQAFVFTMLTITYLSMGIQTKQPQTSKEPA